MTERKRYKKKKAINTKEKEMREGEREDEDQCKDQKAKQGRENPSGPPLSFIT